MDATRLPMKEPVFLKKASTVILVRPQSSGKFELFLTRRSPELEFLGGFHVFPGGTLSEDDSSEEMLSRCHGLSRTDAQQIMGGQPSPELSLAHWVAGIRELFEETGILLSVTENGKHVEIWKETVRQRLSEKRVALLQASINFAELLKSEKLYCDVGRLVYFSRRVTPEKYIIRFDTRFYLALLPANQNPLAQSEEVTDSLWITPARALEQAETGDLAMMPPTVAALRTLADFDSWRSLSAKYPLY